MQERLLPVERTEFEFRPSINRVIPRFFYTSHEKSINIIKGVQKMDDEAIRTATSTLMRKYTTRHRSISEKLYQHFDMMLKEITHYVREHKEHQSILDFLITVQEQAAEELIFNHTIKQQQLHTWLSRKLLLGGYFTHEYAIEAAAFFNPSIVSHPNQSYLYPGEKRVVISFRATGEGHISSLAFREAVIQKDNSIRMQEMGRVIGEAEEIVRHRYSKKHLCKEVQLTISNANVDSVFEALDNHFTYTELEKAIEKVIEEKELSEDDKHNLRKIARLASTHYEVLFSADTSLSERVIFPVSEREKNGIEDVRFVEFEGDKEDEDKRKNYYATYTAYDGKDISPKLIQTRDFYRFYIFPLHGRYAKNKGMALFPRKINGRYAALLRIDGTNNYISFSDHVQFWDEKPTLIQKPELPWEFIQIGNCGSPIETKDGWLVLTHGVGAMREYCLGAILLDLDDPTKVIGKLKQPLLVPNQTEREGYVPNVVYSCGAMVHNGSLVIPYAMSDYASTYAHIPLKEVLRELKKQ